MRGTILMARGSKVTDRRLLSFPCLSVKTMVSANRRLVAVLFSATMSRIWSSGPWALMLTPGEIPASCRLVNRLKMTNPYMTPRCTDGTEVIEFRATERPHAELIERKFRKGKLTKRQYDKMLAHCEHHTLKHIQAMLGSLETGASFKKAHDEAMDTVGK